MGRRFTSVLTVFPVEHVGARVLEHGRQHAPPSRPSTIGVAPGQRRLRRSPRAPRPSRESTLSRSLKSPHGPRPERRLEEALRGPVPGEVSRDHEDQGRDDHATTRGEVHTRMNTKDYGDVLVIPNGVTAAEHPTFFEPLGTVDELKEKYRFVDETGDRGKVYGLAITGNAPGLRVQQGRSDRGRHHPAAEDARTSSSPPCRPSRTRARASIPLYTNYKDGWPLRQWERYTVVAISGDPEGTRQARARRGPMGPGQGAVHHRLADLRRGQGRRQPNDPTTTNWEKSKELLATGKIGAMVLGSWSIVQMQGGPRRPAKTRRHRLPAVPGPDRRQVPLRHRRRPPERDQRQLQAQGRGPGLDRLVRRRVQLRHRPGRHLDRADGSLVRLATDSRRPE